ncbi:hypothetical protein [Nostoc sp.]
MREHVSREKKTTTGFSIPSLKHPTRGFGLESSAISRQAVPKIQPLHKPLTHDISRIPLRTQAKLSISQPGDIYEQEADSVAQRSPLEKTQKDSFLETSAEPIQQPIQKKESLTGAITSLTTALSSGHVVQLQVKIKGKQTKKYANFSAFKKSPLYKPLITSLTKYSPEVVEFHLKQLFSTDAEFENEQHFTEALTYDIEHKSMSGQEHTLQEQYMTLFVWKKRETGTQSATDAEAGEGEPETLKVYRTMKLRIGKNLKEVITQNYSGHLGDFKTGSKLLIS